MGLVVSDLVCARSGRLVIAGLSLRIDPGEALLVRGGNGVGKSTLLRILATLLPFDAGRVTLDRVSLAEAPESFADRIAYCGHIDGVKSQFTVIENLRFWASVFGERDAAQAARAFGLTEIADRPAHLCSAGQKRRIGLARLALARRRLWLLDEPTVSLDADAAAILRAALESHLAVGGMALIATHADMALKASRELTLAPPAPGAGAPAGDPFLGGPWE